MTRIPEDLLQRLAEVIRRRLGLHFPAERWPDLVRGVEATCRDLGEPEVEGCVRKLVSASLDIKHIEILGRNLTIGETYFFREESAFRALEKEFLPDLLARRRREEKILRFWSAACATGEEAYSLAILLRSQIPDLEQWQVTILATDINTDALRKAERGEYGNWSFRTRHSDFRENWFTRTERGLYRIRPEIRRMVTFAYHNLADDPCPSLANNTNAMDVIFCRNVLMYFAEEDRQRVLDHLQNALVPGGLLVVGAAEISIRPRPGLVQVNLPDVFLLRKESPWEPKPPRPLSSPAPFGKLPPTPPSAGPIRHPPGRPETRKPAERTDLLAWFQEAYRRGDYFAVCRRAAELRRQEADFPALALVAARACANTGHLQDALAWVNTVVAIRRTEPEAHYLRAMILDEEGKTPESLDALRTTLYLDPDFIPACVALGNIFRRQGEKRQADRHFRNALVLLEPLADDDPVPHVEEMRAGRLREAVIAAMGGASGKGLGR